MQSGPSMKMYHRKTEAQASAFDCSNPGAPTNYDNAAAKMEEIDD